MGRKERSAHCPSHQPTLHLSAWAEGLNSLWEDDSWEIRNQWTPGPCPTAPSATLWSLCGALTLSTCRNHEGLNWLFLAPVITYIVAIFQGEDSLAFCIPSQVEFQSFQPRRVSPFVVLCPVKLQLRETKWWTSYCAASVLATADNRTGRRELDPDFL